MEAKRNWKTTILGVLTIIGGIIAAGKALLDSDPATVPSIEVLITAITAGIGLIAAADAKPPVAPAP